MCRHVHITPASFVPGVVVDVRVSFRAFSPKDDKTFKIGIVLHTLALIEDKFAKVCRLLVTFIILCINVKTCLLCQGGVKGTFKDSTSSIGAIF